MARLIASEQALRLLPALAQRPDGLRPAEASRTLEVPFSTLERGLEVLLADGIVERHGRRHVLAPTARAAEAVRFALAFLDGDDALGVLARANPAVEFCGLDATGAVVVIRRFSEPADEARFHRAIEDLRVFHPDRLIDIVSKSQVRDRLLEDPTPRKRAQQMRILAGSVDRTFPDRTHSGDFAAPSLGRLSDTLVVPSQRRLRDLARRHGLRRIVAFGSATRADFRPDSDLDLLVEPAPGHPFGLRQRVALMAEVERLFDRDVDLVAQGEARPQVAKRVSEEGVLIYGPAS